MNSKRIMWCFWTSCIFITISGILLYLMSGQINGRASSNSIAYLFAGGSLVSATVGAFLLYLDSWVQLHFNFSTIIYYGRAAGKLSLVSGYIDFGLIWKIDIIIHQHWTENDYQNPPRNVRVDGELSHFHLHYEVPNRRSGGLERR